MVVGSDRVQDFKKLLQTYNGEEKKHGFYDFDNIDVVSAGERDPDAEGVEGMSTKDEGTWMEISSHFVWATHHLFLMGY